MKPFYTKLLKLLCCLSLAISCKKFIQITAPKGQLSENAIFSSDPTAKAAIRGIYAQIMQSSGNLSSGTQSITVLAGLSADEFTNYSSIGDQKEFFENKLQKDNSYIYSIWAESYRYIYQANVAIEGLTGNKLVSAPVGEELMGEAKFIRAFCYFYLVNLFGDVPLILNSDYITNSQTARSTTKAVYAQIIEDLQEAQDALPDNWNGSNGERTLPTKWAATALLGRCYLYIKNWSAASAITSKIIDSSGDLFDLPDSLDEVFLATSKEAIWQLKPVLPGYNTFDGFFFNLTSRPTLVTLSPELRNSFEVGDRRSIYWVDSIRIDNDTYYYSYKYRVKQSSSISEYLMVFRLAEQYLIRSEARANQNDLAGAISDLNLVRHRAGLPNTNPPNKSALFIAIENERLHELFSEWGHRWLDLKRTERAIPILSSFKTNLTPNAILYPIPQSDILANALLNQNPGY
jgi:hypothetical protein